MSGTQAAANALTNLARAAVGLGFAGSALSASMYNGTWHGPRRAKKRREKDGEKTSSSHYYYYKKKCGRRRGGRDA